MPMEMQSLHRSFPSPFRKKDFPSWRSVTWGTSAGVGGGAGETNLTLQGFGAKGGLFILSGGWMLDCFMRWDKWDWLAVFSGTRNGWVSNAACKATIGGIRLLRNLTWGTARHSGFRSFSNKIHAMWGAGWGGEAKRLWRCLKERKTNREGEGVGPSGKRYLAHVRMSYPNPNNRAHENLPLFK